MNKENLEQCCINKPILIVEYDVGILGKRKFKVCQEHIRKKPWNQHIITQIQLGGPHA